jgi:uncharacterized membrane-anchored protein
MAKKIIVLAFFILVLSGLNYAIYDKNEIKKNGEIVYLKLRPVDPRSLMQGDYMALAYDLELKADKISEKNLNNHMIIESDKNHVAQYVKVISDKELDDHKLSANQKIIKLAFKYNQAQIKPNAFFFQEGHGRLYQNAQYGIFKFKDSDTYILDGLADENLKRLGN